MSGSISERLDSSRRAVLDAISGMSEQEFRARAAPGEWSVAEVLAHVLATERILTERARNALTQDGYVATRVTEEEPDEQAKSMAKRLPVPQILHGMLAQRRDTLRLLAPLTPESLARTFLHPRFGERNVAGLFQHLADHDEEHARQITELRSVLTKPEAAVP
jgi:uncharacterized damage-inducible protein DinB